MDHNTFRWLMVALFALTAIAPNVRWDKLAQVCRQFCILALSPATKLLQKLAANRLIAPGGRLTTKPKRRLTFLHFAADNSRHA